MKNLILLFAFIQALSINAQQIGLSIYSERGEPFQLYANGILQNEYPQSEVTVRNTHAQFVDVMLVFRNRSVLKERLLLEPGVMNNFNLKYNRRGFRAIAFHSTEPIVPRHRTPRSAPNHRHPTSRGKHRNFNNGRNRSIPALMSEAKMQELEFYLNDLAFDRDRLDEAKIALQGERVTSAQVSRLMGAFSFDSSKLDFAKFAFDRTVDRNNYHRVKQQLTFNSSIRELNRHIYSQMAYR